MEAHMFLSVAILFLIVVFYLLPCVIASTRKTGHQGAIFFVNMIFGWTVLGWIAALIWAVVEKPGLATSE
jgi:hypothetical protein